MLDFGIGYTEIMVIAIVALVVIGPKDLPKVLRHIGQMTAAMRRMAGEFQRHLDDAMREAGVDEVRREVTNLTSGGLDDTVRKTEDDIKKAMQSAAPAAPTLSPAPAAAQPAPTPAIAAGATPAAVTAAPAPEAVAASPSAAEPAAQPAAPAASPAPAAPAPAANGRDHA
jgi:sec-independent protein translocase protein TatB